MDNKIKEILQFISEKFQSVNWALIGSANLAFQGINIDVHDIDILTDEKSFEKIKEIFKDFKKPAEKAANSRFKSNYEVFLINNIKVEVMEGLMFKDDKNRWIKLFDLSDRIFKQADNLKVPVMPLKKSYEAYIKSGKAEKANLIKKFIEKKK